MSTSIVDIFISVGSNLQNPSQQVLGAIEGIKKHHDFVWVASSRLYQTKPVGYLNQPDFINAAIWLKTALTPQAVLSILQQIEYNHGRERNIINGPRTLDLDLLIHGDTKMDNVGLTLPHPRMFERKFVLQPLAEIAADYILFGKSVAEHLTILEEQTA